MRAELRSQLQANAVLKSAFVPPGMPPDPAASGAPAAGEPPMGPPMAGAPPPGTLSMDPSMMGMPPPGMLPPGMPPGAPPPGAPPMDASMMGMPPPGALPPPPGMAGLAGGGEPPSGVPGLPELLSAPSPEEAAGEAKPKAPKADVADEVVDKLKAEGLTPDIGKRMEELEKDLDDLRQQLRVLNDNMDARRTGEPRGDAAPEEKARADVAERERPRQDGDSLLENKAAAEFNERVAVARRGLMALQNDGERLRLLQGLREEFGC